MSDDISNKIYRLVKKSKIDINNEETYTKEHLELLVSNLQKKFIDDHSRITLLERSLSKSNIEIKEYLIAIEKVQALATHTAKMAEIGSLASNISHEINNPLAVISGTSEMMLMIINKMKGNVNNITEKELDFLTKNCNTLLKTATKAGKIISGLKRLSNSTVSSEKTRQNIYALIEESFSFGFESLKKSRIQLDLESNNTEIYTNVLEIELSQVILNVLTNAKQALEKLDSSIDRRIHIKLEDSDRLIKIIITNTGPKIPDNVKDKIFDSFFTTKKNGEGTGIGLHISRKLMDQMNGKIYLNDAHDTPQFVIEIPKS